MGLVCVDAPHRDLQELRDPFAQRRPLRRLLRHRVENVVGHVGSVDSGVAEMANRGGDDRLRPLLDAFDVDGTEKRLRIALAAEATDAGRAEVLTQLARVELGRGRLEAAQSLLDEADDLAGATGAARARVWLEGGRVARRAKGNRAALPLLERAFDEALAAGEYFIAADAAHSCALAGDMVAWTRRGLDVAGRYEAAAYWKGTLLMNLGDWQFDRGEYARSLESFRAALEAREQEPRNPELTEYARFGVARALRALARPLEAVPLLEQAVAWTDASGQDWPDAILFREELAAARDMAETAD
jgi:tetratricopeptide (TPR) repeat protein